LLGSWLNDQRLPRVKALVLGDQRAKAPLSAIKRKRQDIDEITYIDEDSDAQ
jgi:hypothetical protein